MKNPSVAFNSARPVRTGTVLVAAPDAPAEYRGAVVVVVNDGAAAALGLNLAAPKRFGYAHDHGPHKPLRPVLLHPAGSRLPGGQGMVLGTTGYAVSLTNHCIVRAESLPDDSALFANFMHWSRARPGVSALGEEVCAGLWRAAEAPIGTLIAAAPEKRWEVAAQAAGWQIQPSSPGGVPAVLSPSSGLRPRRG